MNNLPKYVLLKFKDKQELYTRYGLNYFYNGTRLEVIVPDSPGNPIRANLEINRNSRDLFDMKIVELRNTIKHQFNWNTEWPNSQFLHDSPDRVLDLVVIEDDKALTEHVINNFANLL